MSTYSHRNALRPDWQSVVGNSNKDHRVHQIKNDAQKIRAVANLGNFGGWDGKIRFPNSDEKVALLMLAFVFCGVCLAGCTTTDTTGSSPATFPTPDNPAMCAIPGPNHTAVLSFGPDYINNSGVESFKPHVPKGFDPPTLTNGVSGDIVCTKESMPYAASRGTVACPISDGKVQPDCHPWGKAEVDYFNGLKANPDAAKVLSADHANDSRAIGNIVEIDNEAAGNARGGPCDDGGCTVSIARASIIDYNGFTARYRYPPTL